MATRVGERFTEFYEKWVCQLDGYLQQLLRISRDNASTEADQKALVARVTSHLKEYYSVKWSLAQEDVLSFYCPVWLTNLENAYSWFTGWKPSTIFRLIDSVVKTRVPGSSLSEMTEEQLRKIEALRMKVRSEEEKVEREMERQQMGLADRKILDLARLASRVRNGGESAADVDGLVNVAVSGLMIGLEKVMKGADCARLRTLKGVLDNLNTKQSVDFLAAVAMLLIQLRQWGKRRDRQQA